MPIYEYRCVDCGYQFEEIQQFSDPDPENCPECGRTEVRRLVSQSNFALKGGGWFDDGYGASSTSDQSTSSSTDSCGTSEACSSGACASGKEEAAAE